MNDEYILIRWHMAAIDFKEIPEAHIPSGKQDTFEFFAEEFLKAIGFEIHTRPSRGRDEGMDLIVIEKRKGIVGDTNFKWLVSCKHKAYSGNTVNNTQDEKNIVARVSHHGCEGFIGFYSVGISSGLSKEINKIRESIPCKIYDNETIESHLIAMAYSSPDLFKRFFPESYARYIIENPEPAPIYTGNPTIQCAYCEKDLLTPKVTGMFIMIQEFKNDEIGNIVDVYPTCHGHCDKILTSKYGKGFVDLSLHLSDFTVPQLYIKHVSEYMFDLGRGAKGGKTFTEDALRKLIISLRVLFTRVARRPNKKENDRTDDIINFDL